jgi:hypothetical protein
MSSRPFARRRIVIGIFALLTGAPPLQAQLITPKTVPIHQGEQFGIYPSQWPSMGGVSIALEDTIGDPWGNPAKATRLTSGSLQVMPFTHHATAGGGRTLPVSILQTGGNYAGGALFSMQEVERRNAGWNTPLSDRRASNQYFSGLLARRFGGGLSVGAGFSTADLKGVDGVSMLYDGNDRVRQSGGSMDARLGLTKDFTTGATLELVGVHNRYEMSHDVHYPQQWRWADCVPCPPGGPCPIAPCSPTQVPARDEHHDDRSNISGLHAVFLTPKTAGGWRMGYLFTANRLSHPKLPDYQLPTVQSIPRDPGNTNAFNFGFGAVRALGNSTFGLDVIREPMSSHTWADAARDTIDADGGIIRQGAHTVDNRFKFSNSRINVGIAHDIPGATDSATVLGFQFGVSMRAINYTLDQTNHVTKLSRSQDEGWTEWTPTFAINLRSKNMTVSYAVSRTCATSCFSMPFFGGGDDVSVGAPSPAADPSVLAPPNGPLSFDGGSSGQHRVMVSIRLR